MFSCSLKTGDLEKREDQMKVQIPLSKFRIICWSSYLEQF